MTELRTTTVRSQSLIGIDTWGVGFRLVQMSMTELRSLVKVTISETTE